MENNIAINFLIKIGEKQYMNNLLTKGELYFNTYKYFRTQDEAEKKELLEALRDNRPPSGECLSPYRRDNDEGLEQRIAGSLKFQIQGKEFSIKEANLNLFQDRYSHLYCMYAIDKRIAHKTYRFDERNTKFGESAIFIKNPNVFIERVKTAIVKLDQDCTYMPVIYYNEESKPAKLTPFHKASYFDFQNEFRIVTNVAAPQAFILKIGSIEDIAFEIESTKLLDIQLEIES